MEFNMPGSYNLRSLQKKEDIYIRNCYLQKYSKIKSPDAFNPIVCLERLKLLECQNTQNGRFYIEKGRITIKQNKSVFLNKKYLLKFFCTVFIVVTSVICWRDYFQSNDIGFSKKFADIFPGIQNLYFDTNKFCLSILYQSDCRQKKKNIEDQKSISVTPREEFITMLNNSEIRQLVRGYITEIKGKHKVENILKPSKSFIEEQCSANMSNNFNSVKNTYYNTTFFDLVDLTDYALESQGAKIVSVFNTELYGTIAVKYLNLNLWPKLTNFLMKYLKCFSLNSPNSVLIPWKKPGDCWAFKGSHGRVQIQLSEEIIITAVSIDHIPREAAPNGSILSAPKKFTIVGIEESKTQISRIHLGTYEYKNTGPATQTFFILPKLEVSCRRVEVIIESNHGNQNYTCIYKIRVYGHK